MAEPVFFPEPTPLTVAEIAELTGAGLPSGSDTRKYIRGVAALAAAGPEDLTFFENRHYADELAKTKAGVCLCTANNIDEIPPGTIAIAVAEPHRAFAQIAATLFPLAVRPMPILGDHGISERASVHPTAKVEPGATVEAGAVVGARAEIGSDSLIAAGAIIGPDVRIGRHVSIGPCAVVTHALIGDQVTIHAGACVGQDGFGYIPGKTSHTKIVQVGRVIVQDGVEIGANTTIDRGSNRDTVIGEGTKIDNLVQIGHNVVIGRNCLVAGHVGISGSVTIGDGVLLGGKVGIRDNVVIGRGAILAASSAVGTDVPENARWGGTPARPIKEWLRENSALRRLTQRRGEFLKKRAEKDDGRGGPPDER